MSFYSPDCCVERGSNVKVYGALYYSCDMTVYDEVVNQLNAVKPENSFEGGNDLPFSSIITLDMCDWRHSYHKNIEKKMNVQYVLVNQKQTIRKFLKEK